MEQTWILWALVLAIGVILFQYGIMLWKKHNEDKVEPPRITEPSLNSLTAAAMPHVSYAVLEKQVLSHEFTKAIDTKKAETQGYHDGMDNSPPKNVVMLEDVRSILQHRLNEFTNDRDTYIARNLSSDTQDMSVTQSKNLLIMQAHARSESILKQKEEEITNVTGFALGMMEAYNAGYQRGSENRQILLANTNIKQGSYQPLAISEIRTRVGAKQAPILSLVEPQELHGGM